MSNGKSSLFLSQHKNKNDPLTYQKQNYHQKYYAKTKQKHRPPELISELRHQKQIKKTSILLN